MNVYVTNLETNLRPVLNSQVAEELTADGTVRTPAALSDLATHAELSVKTASVLVTLDGTAPATAGAGALLPAGNYVWSKAKLKQAKFIEAATDTPAPVPTISTRSPRVSRPVRSAWARAMGSEAAMQLP